MAEMKARVVITADGAGVLKEAKKVLRSVDNLNRDIRDSFRRGVSDSGELLTGLAERAGQAFGVLRNPMILATGGLLALGTAAVQAGRAALALGSSFDKNMGNVSTLLDTTKVDMQALGSEVLRIAEDFRRPPAMIADALYEWISANGRIDDGLQQFSQSVKASVAGVTEAKTAVDGMTTILNAYGAEAGGASRVSDLMFQTVNKGKIRFEELAGQIGLVISTAKAANVPLTDLMAAIATATAQGIRPSSAMEGLRSAISNIIKPSDQAMTTAKLLGLQWGVSALKAKGLSGLLKDVREKTKGNTEAMAQLFGDVTGLNVVLALTGEGAGMFADNLVLMEQAGGATDEAFRKQTQTWDEVVKGLEAMGQAALTEVFNKFKPYLMEAGQWLLDNWPRVREQLSQTGSDLAGLATTGLTPFKLAWEGIKGALSAAVLFLQGDSTGAVDALRKALDDATRSLGDFKTAWESISLPEWVKTLGTIAVSVGAFSVGVRAAALAANLLAEGLLMLAGAATAGGLGSVFARLAGMTGVGALTTALGNLWAAVQLTAGALGGLLVRAFTLVIDKAAFLAFGLAGVLDKVVALGAGVVRFLGPWGLLASAVVASAALIIAKWDTIGPFFGRVWDAIKNAFSTGTEAVRAFLTEVVPRWWDAFSTWMSTTLARIGTWFMEMPGNLAEKVGFVAGWLSVKIPEWWGAFKKWLDDTLTGIGNWFAALPGKLAELIKNVGEFLTTEVPAAWTAFKDWLGDLTQRLETFFTELPGKFTAWLTRAVDAIDGLWEAFKAKGVALANAIWDGMKSTVSGFFSGVQRTWEETKQRFAEGFRSGQEAAGGAPAGAEDVPQFAAGGVVKRRLLAVVGEAGEEAIVPRRDAANWLPLIAQWAGLANAAMAPAMPALAGVGGGFGGGFTINGGLTVVVQAPAGTENPHAWGQAAGDGLYERLARMIKL